MANAANIVLVEGATSTVSAPAAGNAAVLVDTSNHLNTKDTNSNIWIPGLQSSLTAATAAINTTETLINTPLTIPVGLWQAGSTVRFTVWGTNTSTAGNASTFTFRAGTLGTTSDASVATWAITSATSGTTIPFFIVITYTCRTTGAPGTGNGSMQTSNQGTTGIFTAVADVRTTTANTGPPTTTATKLDLTYVSAATTTTTTVQGCLTEFLPV